MVPDIETCDFMAGTVDLDEYRRSNIRAVQSTPLVSRSGQLLGMISTHWREPHQPTERALLRLDITNGRTLRVESSLGTSPQPTARPSSPQPVFGTNGKIAQRANG
jgi:hypothetical protein